MALASAGPYFLDHMQIICTLLQTDNHVSTSPVLFVICQFNLNDCTEYIRNMDLEYVKQNGYAAWQVIPLFFCCIHDTLACCWFLLVSGQLAWYSYIEDYNIEHEHTLWKESWTVLIAGICVLSVALLCSIIVCLLVPVIRKRRQRARARHTVPIPEPEHSSVEGEIKTWFASSPSDVQEVQESLHTLPHRCPTTHDHALMTSAHPRRR